MLNPTCSSIMFVTSLLFLIFGSIACDEGPVQSKALVIEKPITVTKNEGENVSFPCSIRDLGEHDSVVWNRGPTMNIYYLGETKLRTDPRVTKASDSSNPILEITNLSVKDADTYQCQIGATLPNNNSVAHKLIVHQHPKIISYSPETEKIVENPDKYVKLSCISEGKPDPEITWYHIPKGMDLEKRVVGRGSDLNFTQINPRTDSGTYICEASNVVGKIDHSFELDIVYKPEIEVDNPIMHAGKNADTFLSCRIYSNPQASVVWTRERDSKTFKVSEGDYILSHVKNDASLTIRTTSEKDFDNYTCIAQNDLGQAMGKVELVGTPSRPKILSYKTVYSTEPQYTVEWEVTSNYDVVNYRLKYRLARFNDSVEVPGDWIEMEIPAHDNELSQLGPRETSMEFIHNKKYTIENIELGASYEIQVQAENEYGQGKPSEVFSFKVQLPHHRGSFSKAVSISSFQFLPLVILIGLATFLSQQDY